MKTTILKEPTKSTDQTRTQSTEDYWTEADKVIQCNIRGITARAERRNDSDSHLAALELANSAKDAWLIAHSQNLRVPLMAMASMLGLMELGHKLACVR